MYGVKNINKYIEKNCASRWSFAKYHYMMHGQQNIKDVGYYFTIISVQRYNQKQSASESAICNAK